MLGTPGDLLNKEKVGSGAATCPRYLNFHSHKMVQSGTLVVVVVGVGETPPVIPQTPISVKGQVVGGCDMYTLYVCA